MAAPREGRTVARRFALLAASCAALGSFLILATSAVAVTCDRVAAPRGSDANPGTVEVPFRTAHRLFASLNPGDTGCLRRGTYHDEENDGNPQEIQVRNGGTARRQVTIRSYPGERATLSGRLYITRQAPYVTISRLNLDGSNPDRGNLPSPTVNANHTSFKYNDVTNDNTGICFSLGHPSYGSADNTFIYRNRIHNCGRLPATNYDHGIYISLSEGSVISDNYIYNNADRGIQLYPNAQQTRIVHNVIDGNGENIIFSGTDGVASNDNKAWYNVITNSAVRYNVESWYPEGNPIGEGNFVEKNCIYGGVGHFGPYDEAEGGIGPQVGFTAINNLIEDPFYRDRDNGDFRMSRDSPCRSFGPRIPRRKLGSKKRPRRSDSGRCLIRRCSR